MNKERAAELQKEIASIFSRNNTPEGFHTLHCKEDCDKLLEGLCAIGSEFDPRDEDKEKGANLAYIMVAESFMHWGLRSDAISTLIDGWNRFANIQISTKQFIYRAGISVKLADYFDQNFQDIGASIRWLLHTQAADMLRAHDDGGGRHRLESILGISKSVLRKFDAVALANRDDILDKQNGDWSKPQAFAEDVIVRFVLLYPELAQYLSQPTSVIEFPISQSYLQSLSDQVNYLHKNETDKGKALEDLASYLFTLVPGWIPRRNIKRNSTAFENDIVVINQNPASNYTAEIFGRAFLVECKNHQTKVGSDQVGYFLYRMLLTHTTFGAIFATSGITGKKDKDATAAHNLINNAFHEHGIICTVIVPDELDQIANGDLTFGTLLLEKAHEVRFGRSFYFTEGDKSD